MRVFHRRSIFLLNLHHAYAQTDGTYAWPNSREGDMLRQGMREVEHLRAKLAEMRQQRDEAVNALKRIAHYDYRGNRSGESQIAMDALIAMRRKENGNEADA
jgi:hypothetical protein